MYRIHVQWSYTHTTHITHTHIINGILLYRVWLMNRPVLTSSIYDRVGTSGLGGELSIKICPQYAVKIISDDGRTKVRLDRTNML